MGVISSGPANLTGRLPLMTSDTLIPDSAPDIYPMPLFSRLTVSDLGASVA